MDLDYSNDPRVAPFDGDGSAGYQIMNVESIDVPDRWVIQEDDHWNVIGGPAYGAARELLGTYASAEEAVFAVIGPPTELLDDGDGNYRMHLRCVLDSDDPDDHYDLLVRQDGGTFYGAYLERNDDYGAKYAPTPVEAVRLFFGDASWL
jgi:hypothetical protein